jgi:tripartite-type tricarboxylate transporter receptor subunit TctC
MRRSVIVVAVFLWVFGLSQAFAQPYPNRPIQLIIPNVPGAIVDINARALAEELGKILGTQIVSLNKPGAGTMLGMDIVAKSKKDGYTLSYTGNSGIVYARILNPETLPYDPEKDLEPLGLHVFVPMAIAVQASSPWKSFRDVLEYAKKNPEKIRVNTIGVGSTNHFYIEVVQSLTGIKFTHIPFKGGESVITALLGGHVEMTCDAVNKFTPHVESGKLRVLLLSNKMADFPTVPTMSDLGYKEELPSVWFAVYGPSGLPEEVKKVLIPAIEKAVKQPELKSRIEKLQFVVQYKSPAELRKYAAEEYEKGLAIANKVGLRTNK